MLNSMERQTNKRETDLRPVSRLTLFLPATMRRCDFSVRCFVLKKKSLEFIVQKLFKWRIDRLHHRTQTTYNLLAGKAISQGMQTPTFLKIKQH